MPKAGKLRKLVRLQSDQGAGQTPTGQHTEGWQTYAERWASVEPTTGREYWAMQQAQATVTHTVRLRYTPGVKRGHRLLYKVPGLDWSQARVLMIEVVRDLEERHVWLELLCLEAA
jgi:SPP1 family predicted phage head-tail adaptor